MLYFVNRPNFIPWYFLRYCTICALQFFVINCEINLIFLIKPFLIIDKFAIIHSRLSSRFSSRLRSQDKNILRIKRAFKVTWNKFSIIFQELLLAKSCLRLESTLLKRPSVYPHLLVFTMPWSLSHLQADILESQA